MSCSNHPRNSELHHRSAREKIKIKWRTSQKLKNFRRDIGKSSNNNLAKT